MLFLKSLAEFTITFRCFLVRTSESPYTLRGDEPTNEARAETKLALDMPCKEEEEPKAQQSTIGQRRARHIKYM